MVAKIKFIVVTFSRVFSEYETSDTENKKRFVKLTEEYIGACQSMWPRFFLLKHLFRKYGQNVLMNSKNNELFEWIRPNEFIAYSNNVKNYLNFLWRQLHELILFSNSYGVTR